VIDWQIFALAPALLIVSPPGNAALPQTSDKGWPSLKLVCG